MRILEVTETDQAWYTDITNLPMAKGYAYLVPIMNWKSRAVLCWEVSNPMDSAFCVRAQRSAMERTGKKPKIINTDRGCPFTCKN